MNEYIISGHRGTERLKPERSECGEFEVPYRDGISRYSIEIIISQNNRKEYA
jgi:hypothetical protein